MEPKCSKTCDFPDLFFIISNGIEVDDAVAMIYVAIENEPVSPTVIRHICGCFSQENKSIRKVCITNGKRKVFQAKKLCKLMSWDDVTIAF